MGGGFQFADWGLETSSAGSRAAGKAAAFEHGSRESETCREVAGAGVAQSVERVLGKDEVSGSNPDTSSILEIADCELRIAD